MSDDEEISPKGELGGYSTRTAEFLAAENRRLADERDGLLAEVRRLRVERDGLLDEVRRLKDVIIATEDEVDDLKWQVRKKHD